VVTNVLEVNPERLWDSLEKSAKIGRFRDVGLRRLALSAEDKQMRELSGAFEITRLFRSLSHWCYMDFQVR
jgi:hypothetical protein